MALHLYTFLIFFFTSSLLFAAPELENGPEAGGEITWNGSRRYLYADLFAPVPLFGSLSIVPRLFVAEERRIQTGNVTPEIQGAQLDLEVMALGAALIAGVYAWHSGNDPKVESLPLEESEGFPPDKGIAPAISDEPEEASGARRMTDSLVDNSGRCTPFIVQTQERLFTP